MKFTLVEIRGMSNSLYKLIHLDLPVRISYRLSKLLSFCDKESILIEKTRKDLVKKYSDGKEDANGGFKVLKENEDKFRDEYDKFLMEEIEFSFEPISIEDLGDVKMSPMDLLKISKIIKENQGN